MTVLIRHATPADASALADVLNPIIRRGGTTAYEVEVDAAHFETVMARLAPRETLFVGEDAGPAASTESAAESGAGEGPRRVIGYQLLQADARLPADIASIASFVAIGVTARGVGRALAARTLPAARQAGWAGIDATIRADNAGGLAFYSRLGFADHKVFDAVPLRDGTPVDRISKRLLFG